MDGQWDLAPNLFLLRLAQNDYDSFTDTEYFHNFQHPFLSLCSMLLAVGRIHSVIHSHPPFSPLMHGQAQPDFKALDLASNETGERHHDETSVLMFIVPHPSLCKGE